MTNEDKLVRLAEQCTLLIEESNVSNSEALLVVLNMLNYHSNLLMEQGEHELFLGDVQEALRKSNIRFNIEDDES